MSTNLYWAPAPPPPETGTFPVALKRAIARRIWGHDGSLLGDQFGVGTGFRQCAR